MGVHVFNILYFAGTLYISKYWDLARVFKSNENMEVVMCWKCYLCCCLRLNCNDSEEARENRRISDAQKREKRRRDRGVKPIEHKNWVEQRIKKQFQYFVHCTDQPPKNIIGNGGLDPEFSREDIRLNGSNAKRNYILSFPSKSVTITPSEIKVSPAIKILWGKSYEYAYCFRLHNDDVYYSSADRSDASPGEVGVARPIPSKDIDAVYKASGKKYIKMIYEMEEEKSNDNNKSYDELL